jgi:transposase-like protein
VFPNEESLLRLVGSILMDINEEWVTGRRYLTMEGEDQARRQGSDKLQKI